MKKTFAIALLLTASGHIAGAQEVLRVVPPRPVKTVKADYTPAARSAGIEGTVVVQAIVQTDGTVGEVKVLRSLDTTFGLDDQAILASKQWRFAPGTRDGKPVAMTIRLEHVFALKK